MFQFDIPKRVPPELLQWVGRAFVEAFYELVDANLAGQIINRARQKVLDKKEKSNVV